VRLVSYKMWYLCSLPNTTCGSERRELGEFRERWEPALWVTLWADAVILRLRRVSYGNIVRHGIRRTFVGLEP